MAETKNVFIPRSIAATNIDSLVKTGVAEIELRNGDIVAVGEKVDGVYKISAPTADTTRFGIVYNADVVEENGWRGLSDDPRNIKFKAGTIVNFYIPKKEDEIAITVASGTKGKYLVPTANKTGYAYAASAPAKGLAYEVTGTQYVSIGNERVPTVEAVCVNV